MNNSSVREEPDWTFNDSEAVSVASLNIAFGSSAIILNSILLLVLYRDPLKKFRTPSTVLVTNLAIADALTGLFAVLRMVYILKGFYRPSGLVIFFYYSTFWTMQSSLFTVLFITWERLMAVAYPIRFKVYVTKSRLFFLSLAGWILSFMFLNLSLILNDTTGRVTFLTFGSLNFLIVSLIVVGYYAIYKILRRKKLEMDQRYGAARGPAGLSRNINTRASKRKRNTLIEDRRLINTFLVITVILLITVFPVIIVTAVAGICRLCMSDALKLYFSLEPVLMLNFNVNPLVYAFHLPTYRQAFLTVFGCRKQPNEVQPEVNELV